MTSPDPVREAAAYQASRCWPRSATTTRPSPRRRRRPPSGRSLAEAGHGPADAARSPASGRSSSASATSSTASSSMSGRYRWIIAHDEPEIVGYDQDLWVARLHHGDDDPADAASRCSRRSGARTSRSGPHDADGAAPGSGMHRERGPGELRPDVPAARRPRPGPSRPGPTRPRRRSARRASVDS